ncbi:hypothetical protein PT974_10534 [Cladobotryum mycophilum]|uniref:C2H2-type domain-containing protein n=1 Tax=Cladobotryum mycophilum TaxID=491253 RepID=A0ABR0SA49_9HYPO
MDSFDFARDGVIRPKAHFLTSKSSSRRRSADSFDDEDPLSSTETQPTRPRLSMTSPSQQQSRLAVVLKASPSKTQPALTWSDDEANVAGGHVISDLASRTKKQTPGVQQTPLQVQVVSEQSHGTSISTSASALKTGTSRGRPRGWKPGMSYVEMRGTGSGTRSVRPVGRPPKTTTTTAAAARSARQVKPKPPPSGFTGWKKRGRPPKASSPQPWEVYRKLDAPFIAFLCEWEGCKAELHNLDTLRRHIYIVHKHRGQIVCRWGKCGRRDVVEPFQDTQAFRTHMEAVHIVPFSWHIGDGPKNSGAAGTRPEDRIPDYLKDAQGNQVTPSIEDQEMEDLVTWRNNRRKLKELLIRMNENLPSEESDAAAAGGGGGDDEEDDDDDD